MTWSRFTLRRGHLGMLAVVAVLTGGTPAWAEDAPDTVVLTGTVVDEAGTPVGGVEVSARGWQKAEAGKTDASGAFRLSFASNAAGGIYASVVARSGDGRLGLQFVSQRGKSGEPVKVVLKPARTLEVRVQETDGRPVAGAEVRVLAGLRPLVSGRTDAQGVWTVQVPADAQGWSVYALKARLGLDYALAGPRDATTASLPPLPAQLTLTLDGARPPLRVKAVDRQGQPLPGVQVGPWLIQKPGRPDQLNGISDFPTTDAQGVATIDWLPAHAEGQFSIIAYAPDYFAPDHAKWFPVDQPVEEVTIALLPYERLAGRVTTADGRPAADVTISVEGSAASHSHFPGETRTDADGRYVLRVQSETAYILTASKDDMVAPYRSGIVVRAGKPVEGVDLVLGQGTRVRGRVTVGAGRAPAADVMVEAVIDKGSIPAELQREGDRYYHGMTMRLRTKSDQDGRYEFVLGPGEYSIQGPERVDPVKIAIPAANPPHEIVRDMAMPRPESGRFVATVVDTDGKPVAKAVVDGAYQAQLGWFRRTVADDQGTIRIERRLDPLVLAVETPDKARGAVVRVDAEAAEARIVLQPTAAASGRLTDTDGKAVVGRKLSYGIKVRKGPTTRSPFSWHFGGTITTDDSGGFRLAGLIVGEPYELYIYDEEMGRIFSAKTKVKADGPGTISLGDVAIDLAPPKPYVPPTPAELTGESFAARKEKTPREKLAYVLVEAKREYTRPLLLFGGPRDPACVDLFRAFEERARDEETAEGKGKERVKTPADLRWEFELASLDASQADVQALAGELGVSVGGAEPSRLAVVSDEGKLIATYPLRLGGDKKLDARALGAFLREHKLATRDAERMLGEGLAKAKADDKRVFLIMSASWCGPCRMLARFLAANKTELARHYVFVKLDISRDTHAEVLRERYEGKEASNGVPWYVILDAAGKPLITSNAKALEEESGSSNIGFPSDKEGIDQFLKMLRETAPGLTDEALAALRQGLQK
jgi:thiol-disulfide isomerase/thioredoxin